MGNEPLSLPLPSAPYRGIEPFRFVDQPIFSGRTDEVRKLVRLITIYRGIYFYGESGAGKSSVINAGLIPALRDEGFVAERVRVQPIADQELVIERIALTNEGVPPFLPSSFAACADEKGPEPARVVLSVEEFIRCIEKTPIPQRQGGIANSAAVPVLIFDQFEELITLFEEAPDSREKFNQAREIQGGVVEMLFALLGDPNLSIKLVFSFREDYLAKVSRRLAAAPQLREQAFRLSFPPETALRNIIRGPFESGSIPPGHFTRRLSESAFDALESSFKELSDTGTINLTEVQIACLALWENEEEEKAFLKEREHREAVRHLFGNYFDRALNRLEQKFQKPAITALTFLVTSSGTRNIVSEDDLLGNVVRDDHLTEPEAREVLRALSRTTRLVFRQTRGDSAFYEISSEFLIPWITEKRQAREREVQLEKQREAEWRLKNERSVGLAARSNATAVDWSQNRKAKANLLLKGVPLCQAAELLEKHPHLLTSEAREFIEASQARRRRGRLLWSAIASVMLALSIWNIFLPGSQKEPGRIFLNCLLVLVLPCILPILDRLPKQVSVRTLAASAWRWSIYSWVCFLLFCEYALNPSETEFGPILGRTLILGCILLVPFLKWRTYVKALRQSIEPPVRLPWAPKAALFFTAALLPIVLFCSQTAPALFRIGEEKATTFSTNSNGWISRTVTDKSTPGAKIILKSYFQPASRTEGYHQSRVKHNRRGLPVEGIYLDAAGNPVTTTNGYQRWIATYGARGELVNLVGFDSNGGQFPLRNALAITEIFAHGEGETVGLQVGDVFWAYEDWNYNDKSLSADLSQATKSLLERINRPGDNLRNLVVLRNGKALTFQVHPGKLSVNFEPTPIPESWIKINARSADAQDTLGRP